MKIDLEIDLKGKKVLVIGGGLSGLGAVKLLDAIGARPVLYDAGDKLTEAAIREKLPPETMVEIFLKELPAAVLDQTTVAVVSPGVPLDNEIVMMVRERQLPLWGELELGFRYSRGKVAAITGTNGKTTTVTLVGEILKAYFPSVYVVGNIGKPYTEIALETTDETLVVAEVSSFQLETAVTFAPAVSALLNITPDHLDRHKTMDCYVAMKEKIAAGQQENDICVINYDNEYTRAFGARCPAKTVYFSATEVLRAGYFLAGEEICYASEGKTEPLLNIREMKLVGTCNAENVMAAMAVCRSLGVPWEIILTTVKNFQPVAHRIEFVAAKGKVDYYNDSKGTNPDAAIQGIRAMDRPTVLLAGGYDKGSNYDEWMENCRGKVKALVVVGATAAAIARCAAEHGIKKIYFCETFTEALNRCRELAGPGDAVLLSPACASWGMFPNYEVRGDCFKEYVLALADE